MNEDNLRIILNKIQDDICDIKIELDYVLKKLKELEKAVGLR